MHEITIVLPDEAYAVAERRAQNEGFQTAEIFLSDFIANKIAESPEGFDYIFTPEIIAELDAAAAEARTGNNLTLSEMHDALAATKKAWLENRRDVLQTRH